MKLNSIYLREKGDTVFLEKYKYLYKYIQLVDTVSKVDSIPVVKIHEVVKKVNKLHTWQTVLMCIGGVFIALCGCKLIKIIKI